MAKLSERQKRFCDEYMIDLNATQAYIRAGYSPGGASADAGRLMSVPCVKAEIDRRQAEAAKRTGVTKERIIRELAKLAFGDATDIILPDGSLNPAASRNDTAAISGIKVKTMHGEGFSSVEKEVKLADKIKAMELLGKFTGHLTDKVDITSGGQPLKIVITDADEDDDEPQAGEDAVSE